MQHPLSARVQLTAVGVVAVLTVVIGVATQRPGGSQAASCLTVVVASSQEKTPLMTELAARYNSQNHSLGGRCVRAYIEEVNSGDAELALESGWSGISSPRPDVWSPASSAWVVLLRQRAPRRAWALPRQWGSLFHSPLVIGMPEPMAKALGWPTRPLGWSDVFALASDRRGWAAYGHPEWGSFRLAKTNPTVSTSGLEALVGTYFAAERGPLTSDVVTSPSVRDFVGRIEASVVHYGETVSSFLRDLRDADDNNAALSYVSALALEEQELVNYNAGIVAGQSLPAPRVPLVAIYPKEGTPVADHPYVVLHWARSNSAASDFYDFLVAPAQAALADESGFRDSEDQAGTLLAHSEFVDAAQPAVALPVPEGVVLQDMVQQWTQLRKPGHVLILFDTSVDASSLQRAASELCDSLKALAPQDRAALWRFPGSSSNPTSPLVPLQPVDKRLCVAMRALQTTHVKPDLDAALMTAVAQMSATFAPSAINAVLLVDLAPGVGSVRDADVQRDLRNQSPDRCIRVFTVGPSALRLQNLALAGRGASYDPSSARRFATDVISNF